MPRLKAPTGNYRYWQTDCYDDGTLQWGRGGNGGKAAVNHQWASSLKEYPKIKADMV